MTRWVCVDQAWLASAGEVGEKQMVDGGGEGRTLLGCRVNDGVSVATGLLDKRGAAKYLNTTVRNITSLMRRRKLTFIKLGYRTVRFRQDELESDLNRLTVQAVGGR